MMEIGRICIKTAGRERGNRCVVVNTIDENFVLVTGPDVKRRRCNIKHLKKIEEKIDIEKEAGDKKVFRLLEKIEKKKVKKETKKMEEEEVEEEKEEEEDVHACDICGKEFSSERGLKIHKGKVH